MKLVIDGREYDPQAQPFIGDLRLLKAEFGFGWGEVARRLQGLDQDADMLALLDDDATVEALVAWMWMSRLRAGERDVTRQLVEMTPLDAIAFKQEPGDELPGDDSVPTSARTGSVPGDDEPAKPIPSKASTKTSRKRSTAA